jgi:hypothetical protein
VVKNPGLLPGKESLKHGDVGKRKEEMREIVLGCWRSCIEAGDGMDDDAEYTEEHAERWRPFVANAIIANPPGTPSNHVINAVTGAALVLHYLFPFANLRSSLVL